MVQPALDLYQKGVELAPDQPQLFSDYLYCLLFDPRTTAQLNDARSFLRDIFHCGADLI